MSFKSIFSVKHLQFYLTSLFKIMCGKPNILYLNPCLQQQNLYINFNQNNIRYGFNFVGHFLA